MTKNDMVEPKIYRNNEEDIKSFYDNFKYWSNGIGELSMYGIDITENDLPEELHHAYHDLFYIDDYSSLHYLVETEKGYGIALVNEYDLITAASYNLDMADVFEGAKKDSFNIASCEEFKNTEIFLGENLGFDNSHMLAVVLPADISIEDFRKISAKLDSLVYEGVNEVSFLINAEINNDFTPDIYPAETLPEGWSWAVWNDGSGHLKSPEGDCYFSYDLSSYASQGGIEFKLTETDSYSVFWGSISEFKEQAESVVKEKFIDKKNSLDEQILFAKERTSDKQSIKQNRELTL